MEYKLYSASIARNAEYCTLMFINPLCVFEKPHKVVFFAPHPVVDALAKVAYGSDHYPIDANNIPLELIPEELQTIHANCVEIHIGLHKHAFKKARGGRPLLTTHLCVFAPMSLVERYCDGKKVYEYIESPQQIAQEIINKYWIPVDED